MTHEKHSLSTLNNTSSAVRANAVLIAAVLILAGLLNVRVDAQGKIAFNSTQNSLTGIYIMDPAGNNQGLLTAQAGDRNPAFNPEGTKIAFISNRNTGAGGLPEIFAMNADGTGQLQLTVSATMDNDPSFGPNGRIVFTSSRDGNREIYIMNDNGTGQIDLTNSAREDFFPAFKPDGSKIAFLSYDSNGVGGIFVMGSDGANPTLILSSPDPFTLAYSSTGKIAYTSRNGAGRLKICVINDNGTNQICLTDGSRTDFSPSFSPDGSKIAFVSQDDFGLGGIFVMNADGSNPTQITHGVNDGWPSWGGAPNTPTGTNIIILPAAGDASVMFAQVNTAGITSFTPIDPNSAGAAPSGYTICPTCPAYNITTTATYVPPVTVCLDVPAGIDATTFNTMTLLHGENGVLVDVTTNRVTNPDGTREICGQVSSLSPFLLAQASVPVSTPPSAPSNLRANAVSTTQINLTWIDNSANETNFELERCDGKGRCRTFTLIASPGQNNVSYSDTGLEPGSPYAYRVRAVNEFGNSAYSNTARERTPRR